MNDPLAFSENDCTVIFDGRAFSSGGAYLLPLKLTGKLAGVLYLCGNPASYPPFIVTDWHGRALAVAHTIATWTQYTPNGVPMKCRQVHFDYEGRPFTGRIVNEDWTMLLHVREISA
jgi:hypothetical protein